MNHLKRLVDSYRLAAKQPPPPGQILVHNQAKSTSGTFQGSRGFRAWWATPGEEFVLCSCGWRSDLGDTTASIGRALSCDVAGDAGSGRPLKERQDQKANPLAAAVS
jgi:hypothetical protein